MLTSEQRDLLRIPLIARLSVNDPNGYPHTVPLWFDLDGDDLVIITDRNTRKVDYLNADPKASICIGGGEIASGEIGAGWLFKGEGVVQEDPGYVWLRRMTYRYESPAAAEKDIESWRTTLDMVIIRFKIHTISKVY
ncbi:MAG: pyridoxamine 5'-phosphate oxidase family protein [Chloroflexota bacterium]|nr:pyridoxamine 5'-phosphate oxidase family protein [Chloroflexota bacterium]